MTKRDQSGERTVVRDLIAHLSVAKFIAIGVDNGEEYITTRVTSEVMDHVFSVDEAMINFESVMNSKQHSVFIVLGNADDGSEVIADWNYSDGDADGFDKAMNAFIDTLNEEFMSEHIAGLEAMHAEMPD